jgi:hypothetical protein
VLDNLRVGVRPRMFAAVEHEGEAEEGRDEACTSQGDSDQDAQSTGHGGSLGRARVRHVPRIRGQVRTTATTVAFRRDRDIIDAQLRTDRRMNRKLVWFIWTLTALLSLWILLYAVGFYFGDGGD